MLGYRHVSAPLVKLQKTLKESLEQPWLGSIQYSPAEGDRKTKQMYVIKIMALYVYTERGITEVCRNDSDHHIRTKTCLGSLL